MFGDAPVELKDPTNWLSFKDLNKLPDFRLAIMRQDQESFERILYENGADLSYGYNVVKCLHRPRTENMPYDGFRVEFVERLDSDWVKSGAASEEAMYASQRDFLKGELETLNPWANGNNTVNEWMSEGEDEEEGER